MELLKFIKLEAFLALTPVKPMEQNPREAATQLVKKFPTFCGTQRYSTLHKSLSLI
jgi:hypothetical protein